MGMEITGKTNIDESPYAGATAPEIDWIKRVKIQSVIQKYTTHSISSTINLPNDVKTDDVSSIYLEAWREGLKGITVYRDGSRSGILISSETNNEKRPSEIIENSAPKRPSVIEADVIRFQNNNEKWIAVIGIINDKPYEIFTGRTDDSFILP